MSAKLDAIVKGISHKIGYAVGLAGKTLDSSTTYCKVEAYAKSLYGDLSNYELKRRVLTVPDTMVKEAIIASTGSMPSLGLVNREVKNYRRIVGAANVAVILPAYVLLLVEFRRRHNKQDTTQEDFTSLLRRLLRDNASA